jgi:tripartite-type tricarboxylate transporter receptor subunit TctC
MTDLMTGIVGIAMDTVTVTEPFIRAGKMRLIASAYGKRVPSFPDAPTLAEQGFPGMDFAAWLGIVVPRATPKDRVERLATAFNQIVQAPETSEKFAKLGTIPHPMGPEEFGAFLARENDRWSAAVKSAGITVD